MEEKTELIDCTGNACIGDEVTFEKAIFRRSWRNPKFVGTKIIEGKIIASSYGKRKGQHSFTIQSSDGATFRILGRNLYRNGVKRKKWPDETLREIALEKKYTAGQESQKKIKSKNEECQKLISEGWDPQMARDLTEATIKGTWG